MQEVLIEVLEEVVKEEVLEEVLKEDYNRIAFLYNSIRVKRNGGEIDAGKGLGTATTLKNLISVHLDPVLNTSHWDFGDRR